MIESLFLFTTLVIIGVLLASTMLLYSMAAFSPGHNRVMGRFSLHNYRKILA